jgi:CHAT domain-containing protein
MARKWHLFFHRIFTVLSVRRQVKQGQPRVRSPLRHMLLAGVIAIVCGLVTPNLAQTIAPPSRAIAQTSPSPSPETLSAAAQTEQTARDHYSARRFNEAATAFQQAAQQYAAQGDPLRQALALSNLSLTYQQLGRWDEAEQAIQAALALEENNPDVNRSPAWPSALAQILDIRGSLELARGRTEEAIATWERSASIYDQLGKPEQRAASQINQARALQNLGLYSRAIGLLKEALQAPQPIAPLLRGVGTDPPDRLDAWLEQEQLSNLLKSLPSSATTVTAARNLGEVLQVIGDLEQSHLVLSHSLPLAQGLPQAEPMRSEAIAAAHLSLGNVIRAQAVAELRLDNMTIAEAATYPKPGLSLIQQELQRRQIEAAAEFADATNEALNDYEQAVSHANSITIQTQAQLNRLSLLLDKQQWPAAEQLARQIEPQLSQLPTSRATIDAQINLAKSLMRLGGWAIGFPSPPSRSSVQWTKVEQLLQTAQNQASQLQDAQAESYALGLLGQLYEQNQQFDQAEAATQQALEKVHGFSAANLPHRVNDTDLAYRWQQQRGRIYRKWGEMNKAIEAYEAAVKILQDRLRMDVASSNLNYQFSFRDDAEPVYRELLDLLLKDPTPKHLQQTREVIASLLETELTSFLNEPCEVVTPREIDDFIRKEELKAAIIYPIVLDDRLELISKFPGDDRQLYHYRAHPIARDELLKKIRALQLALEEDYTFLDVKQRSQEFYRWIVQPVVEQIAKDNLDINTLVFALDRPLQNIPMAALHDGHEYLIKKYAISEVLGLSLEGNPTPLYEQQLRVLAAGLSKIPADAPEEIRLNFLPLPQVEEELDVLESLGADLGIPVTRLLDNRPDRSFTRENFNTRLNQDTFPIVHLATHGIFSVDPEATFLLAYGNEADNVKIEVNELGSLFRQRRQIRPDAIELLVLNACETAAGDDSATLGLAGTAVRAGARSVIASLWTLGDAPSVEFTRHFYENLKIEQEGKRLSKAEALREAQLALMGMPQYEHPRYWAPYILAGNWL